MTFYFFGVNFLCKKYEIQRNPSIMATLYLGNEILSLSPGVDRDRFVLRVHLGLGKVTFIWGGGGGRCRGGLYEGFHVYTVKARAWGRARESIQDSAK